MRLQSSHLRLVASPTTEQHTSACATRSEPPVAKWDLAPLAIGALGCLLIAALGWVLYGVRATQESGLGVPPDAVSVEIGLAGICDQQHGDSSVERAPCRLVCRFSDHAWQQLIPPDVCEVPR
jgi:hypothetical protein